MATQSGAEDLVDLVDLVELGYGASCFHDLILRTGLVGPRLALIQPSVGL